LSAEERQPVIRLDKVEKTYLMGDHAVYALRAINLEIHPGEFLALMGPSGSGKSTLMNILGLLDRPDSGSYQLKGEDVSQLTDDVRSRIRNSSIGFIFQNFNLLPRSTALRNVALPLSYRPLPDSERQTSALNALRAVGLEHRSHHLPTQLSGGERQRVAIARALVGGASVLLADEPTGNLDRKTGEEIMAILTGLTEQGKTVIMVTHDPYLAEMSHRTIRMVDGQII
jgi:putative ABC transport system ATP-binding protein